jgi:hypothetical protein
MITALTVFLWTSMKTGHLKDGKTALIGLFTLISVSLALAQDITLILFLHALAA